MYFMKVNLIFKGKLYKLANTILGPKFICGQKLLMLWYSILYAYVPDSTENTRYYMPKCIQSGCRERTL